ncbi:hypothetical protein ANO11243_038010 [Dothideomycetidae sp. 11243]|nr:hypothetical protein ANO11243_038010 [fungal sp. No.11243]
MSHLLSTRSPPKTFCPSEVARALTDAELSALDMSDWRSAMDAVRALAWRLRDAGELEVLQKGEVLDPHTRLEDVRGPIRLRRTGGT